jgi:AraC-like DNA-binding protein
MSEITVSARKFLRVLDYLERMGLDAEGVARQVNLVPARLAALDPEHPLPAKQYSRMYKAAVEQMQTLNKPLPWAAGIGSEAFELMCHCIIGARTLGAALHLAERFETLLYPLIRHRVTLHESAGAALLGYHIDFSEKASAFIPGEWDRAGSQETVVRASGLLVWHAFCGWLTGQPLEATEVRVAAPYLSHAYRDGLAAVFRCPIHFDTEANSLIFPADQLQRRVVHTVDSLAEFLSNSVYQLIALDQGHASTSAAIKSLVSIDLAQGMPSFAEIADYLHMSESSLRRRLQRENTSYQALKDEVRCEAAIDKLLNQDAKVADIAEYLGFTEPSSFVRSFKGWTGQTPRAYKDRMVSLGEA